YDEKQIHATVDSKAVVVTEPSIRSSLLLNDAVEVEEGEGSKQPTGPQPTPSPTQLSIGDQPHVIESSSGPDNTHSPSMNLEGNGGNKRDQVQLSNDSPLSGGYTSDRAEGGLNLNKLLVLCTNLSNRVLALETTVTPPKYQSIMATEGV
ncbi:hypothetical protein Tco_1435925, partial [Tanacetum coccineum]